MPNNAYFVRNKSATHQLTVLNAKDGADARSIARELIGERNKSLFRSAPVNKVDGYGI